MSVSVNIDVTTGEDFADAINRFDDTMKKQIQAQLSEWVEQVKMDAEQLVPVRTGFLQSSIYAKSGDWQVEVGAQAVYAAAVEFGSYTAKAQPYLRPAVEAYLPVLERFMLHALDSAKAEAQL
jgi:HK97 gp10 family phage protein